MLKTLFADLAFENYEIGAYTSLIAMAEACGHEQSATVLTESLQEEEAMSEWLKANVALVTDQYLDLSARAAA